MLNNIVAQLGTGAGGGGGAFESIATVTASGGESSLSFSSIPQTYQHLQIRFMNKETSTTDYNVANADLTYNINSSNSGAKHSLYGDGSSAVAIGDTYGLNIIGAYMSSNASAANIYAVGIIDFLDYSSTTKNKTIRAIAGSDANGYGGTNRVIALTSNLYASTTAITSITFNISVSGFAAGTTFALYGIKGS